MSDPTIYNATAQTAGTLALAHQKIIRVKRLGVFENITGDCNNVAGVPTPITVARENYGNKGLPSVQKIGDSWVITFDTEAVRDDNGAIAQPWLIALLNIAKAKGDDNQVEVQLFDGLDEDLGAIQGNFSVAVVDLNTGYADKGGYKFTLTSDGVVDDITSPIAGTGEPIIESSLTANGKTVGDVIVLRGYKFTGTTGVTIDAQAATKFQAIDDYTLTAVIPASVSGAAAIIVTNAIGASDPFSYTAA